MTKMLSLFIPLSIPDAVQAEMKWSTSEKYADMPIFKHNKEAPVLLFKSREKKKTVPHFAFYPVLPLHLILSLSVHQITCLTVLNFVKNVIML